MRQGYAYAKINIGLHVLGKRADGYHSIATIFAPLELHDDILIEAAPVITCITQPSLGIAEHQNLAHRAATLLRTAVGIETGAKITITKHIPAGSGLGGGSSDAATTLRLLLSHWNCSMPDSELARLALQIGSDVPFFLHPRLAYAEGRGEIITALPPMRQRIVLVVVPPIQISTTWAYAQLQRHYEMVRPRQLRDALLSTELTDELLRLVCTNDFEEVVFAAYPSIAHIKKMLYAYGASYASLSGTGSAVFGFFDSQQDALVAASSFHDCRTFVTRTLDQFV